MSGGERNVGITKFEVRPRVNRPGDYEILVNVANFSRQPESFDLVLSAELENPTAHTLYV